MISRLQSFPNKHLCVAWVLNLFIDVHREAPCPPQVGVQLPVPTKKAEGISEGQKLLGCIGWMWLSAYILISSRLKQRNHMKTLSLIMCGGQTLHFCWVPPPVVNSPKCWKTVEKIQAEAATPYEPGQDVVGKPWNASDKSGKSIDSMIEKLHVPNFSREKIGDVERYSKIGQT